MGELSIEIVDGRTGFEPGETVDLLVGWSFEAEPDAIEVRAAWTTRGKGTTDLGVVRAERFEHPRAMDGRRFPFELPRAPYSFSGKLVSLVWLLEVVALPTREGRHVEITIGPGGREVLLHGGASGADGPAPAEGTPDSAPAGWNAPEGSLPYGPAADGTAPEREE